MKCNLNGWKILSGQFNSVAHFKKIAVELFGENFEAAEVVNGKYLPWKITDFISSNPELLKKNIGLKPEAFK